MTHRPRVPRLARILLAIVVPASVRDSLLADVDDAFTHPARRRPRLWYWTQAVRTLWPPTLVALYRAERRMPSAMPSQPTRQTARSIASDLRHAGRRIVRNPSVAITVAFLLTAGVASGGVVYSIFSELVRPRVGVPAADVIHVLTATDSTGTSRRNVNRLWLDDLRALPGGVPLLYSTVRDGVARFGQSPLTVRVGFVSPDYYRLVGARAALGRLPSRDATGARREALVSYRVWNTLLAGDADAIGRELYINRAPYMIAGVAPADFDGLEGAAVWIPLDDETAATARIASVQLYARVDDATSVATLTSPVAARVAALLRGADRAPSRLSARFVPVRESMSAPAEGSALRSASAVLAALCILVLVASCANTANLLGMDVLERSHEIAVRAALGASRMRLARQLIVEYSLHAALGIALSVATAIVVIQSMPRWLPIDATSADRFALRPAGLVVVCTCALVTMAVAVALPLARAVKAAQPLRSVGIARQSSGRSVSALVMLQIAQAVVLVAAALTLARSESLVRKRPIGFDGRASHVLIYSLPRALYDTSAVRRFHVRTLQALRESPGITAAMAAPTPLVGFETTAIDQQGSPTGIPVRRTAVSGDYLAAMGTRLLEGRALADAERSPVTVVSRDVARLIAPNGSAIGSQVRLRVDSVPYTVVGVVQEGAYGGNEVAPTVLTPLSARLTYAPTLIVRSNLSRRDVEATTRAAIARLDPDIPVTVLGSLLTLLDRVRFLTVIMRALAIAFCVVALAVSGFGLYAHLARYVTARAGELGLRVALGATPARLAVDLLRRSGRLAGLGLGGGLLGALWVRNVLGRFLLGVHGDALVLPLVAATIALLVLLATLVPGWRVSRVDAARILAGH